MTPLPKISSPSHFAFALTLATLLALGAELAPLSRSGGPVPERAPAGGRTQRILAPASFGARRAELSQLLQRLERYPDTQAELRGAMRLEQYKEAQARELLDAPAAVQRRREAALRANPRANEAELAEAMATARSLDEERIAHLCAERVNAMTERFARMAAVAEYSGLPIGNGLTTLSRSGERTSARGWFVSDAKAKRVAAPADSVDEHAAEAHDVPSATDAH